MGFEAVAGEAVLWQGGANYEKGWEAVGGFLTLTTHRLFFESHRFNVQSGGLGIDLREITGVRRCVSRLFGLLPIIPGAVGVRTRLGKEHRFIVGLGKRNALIHTINQARRAWR